MVGGEAIALRVSVQVGRSNRLRFTNHMAEQPPSLRRVADSRPQLRVDTGGHELHQTVRIRSQDTEGGVAGAHHLARGIHDLLEHVVQVVARKNGHARREQALESLSDAGRFELWGHRVIMPHADHSDNSPKGPHC